MKIACWNVNSIKSRTRQVLDWIYKEDPDILMLQELKCEAAAFPALEFSHLLYNYAISGQRTYNGVAILSKYPIDDIKINFDGNPIPDQARFIEVTFRANIGFCRAICVYVPNGGEVDSDKFKIKIDFYKAFRKYLQSIKSFEEYIIIGGDFNVAPFDIDVYEPGHLQYSTCFTLQERELMRSILNDGWLDLYRLMNPDKEEFSWWDYRGRCFERNKGMRIDMILGNPKFADIIEDLVMDKEVRAQKKASDHIPILVEVVDSLIKNYYLVKSN